MCYWGQIVDICDLFDHPATELMAETGVRATTRTLLATFFSLLATS